MRFHVEEPENRQAVGGEARRDAVWLVRLCNPGPGRGGDEKFQKGKRVPSDVKKTAEKPEQPVLDGLKIMTTAKESQKRETYAPTYFTDQEKRLEKIYNQLGEGEKLNFVEYQIDKKGTTIRVYGIKITKQEIIK